MQTLLSQKTFIFEVLNGTQMVFMELIMVSVNLECRDFSEKSITGGFGRVDMSEAESNCITLSDVNP